MKQEIQNAIDEMCEEIAEQFIMDSNLERYYKDLGLKDTEETLTEDILKRGYMQKRRRINI